MLRESVKRYFSGQNTCYKIFDDLSNRKLQKHVLTLKIGLTKHKSKQTVKLEVKENTKLI